MTMFVYMGDRGAANAETIKECQEAIHTDSIRIEKTHDAIRVDERNGTSTPRGMMRMQK